MLSRLPGVVVLLSVVSIFSMTLPVGAQTTSLYLPAFEAVDGTDLGLALVNSDSVDGQVTITLRTYDGALLAGASIVNPYTLNVASGSKVELRLADLFGAGISSQRGWLQIDSSTPSLKAFSFVFDSSLSFVEGVGVTSVTSNQLIFPKVSQESDTTLRIVNTAAQSLDATISLYDNSGNLTAVLPLSLPAFSGVVNAAVPAAEERRRLQQLRPLPARKRHGNWASFGRLG